MVLEKELRVLHLDLKASRRDWHPQVARRSSLLQWVEPEHRRRPPKPTPTVTQ
jgi:predicted nucleic acid-binding Zn ribbon protein